jgi:hypothetical protein
MDGFPKPIMKWFDLVDQTSMVVVGLSHDEHDTWHVMESESKIKLIGTFTPDTFKGVMKLRKGSQLSIACTAEMFDYLEEPWKTKTLTGKGVSVSELGLRISVPFVYEDDVTPPSAQQP